MIRRAIQSDIPEILRLLIQVNNVHADGRPDIFIHDNVKYTERELTDLVKDEYHPIFVHISDDGHLQGYCFCEIRNHPEGGHLQPHSTLYIDDLCIDQSKRGQGIGGSLYDHVKKFAKNIGCHNLTLNVWECNPSALAFYRKQGLIPMKTTLETLL